jgi:glycosyltransferase involved in cell wall biosynthesis
LTQPEVLAGYRRADLFVLASKLAKDGDRDGLPNVLIEAQSQRLACVSTNVSGIPELIEHGVTGLLTPPNDPAAFARRMEELIRDPARRVALGTAGELRVRSVFAMEPGINALARQFGRKRSSCSAPRLLDPSVPLEHTTASDADARIPAARVLPFEVLAQPRSEPKPL